MARGSEGLVGDQSAKYRCYLGLRFDIAYVTFGLIVRKRYRKVVYEQAHRVLEFPQPFNQSAFFPLFLLAPFPVRRVRRIWAFLISNPEDAIVLLVKLTLSSNKK